MADQLSLGIGLGIGISSGVAGEFVGMTNRQIGLALDALSQDVMTHVSIAKAVRGDSRGGFSAELEVDRKRYLEMVRSLRDDAARKAKIAAGARCSRCHDAAPNPSGCAACNPGRLGERLAEALARVSELEALLAEQGRRRG